MSRTLNFYDVAWTTSRDRALAGRSREALQSLRPLLAGTDAPEIPGRLAVLGHRLAARLHFNAERYRTCRRHLREAARHDPANADVLFELGQAWERDPAGSDRKALAYYRRADRLAPGRAKFLAACGRAWVRNGRAPRGVKLLRAVAEVSPTNVGLLRVVVEGLREADRPRLAYRIVLKAKFLAPACAGVAKLWDDVRFGLAAAGGTSRARVGGPALLTFPGVRLSGAAAVHRVRGDGPAVLRPHFPRTQTRHG